jgi:hypothetical protein
MRNVVIRKGLVIGILILFIGTIILPQITATFTYELNAPNIFSNNSNKVIPSKIQLFNNGQLIKECEFDMNISENVLLLNKIQKTSSIDKQLDILCECGILAQNDIESIKKKISELNSYQDKKLNLHNPFFIKRQRNPIFYNEFTDNNTDIFIQVIHPFFLLFWPIQLLEFSGLITTYILEWYNSGNYPPILDQIIFLFLIIIALRNWPIGLYARNPHITAYFIGGAVQLKTKKYFLNVNELSCDLYKFTGVRLSFLVYELVFGKVNEVSGYYTIHNPS